MFPKIIFLVECVVPEAPKIILIDGVIPEVLEIVYSVIPEVPKIILVDSMVPVVPKIIFLVDSVVRQSKSY